MKKYILTREVVIPGRDLLGRRCKIIFKPFYKPGWYLADDLGHPHPIDHRIAKALKGRIALKVPGIKLQVWEHLGALRFLGIDHVIIFISPSYSPIGDWPPYKTAWEYYEFLAPHLRSVDEEMEWIGPKEDYIASIDQNGLNRKCWIQKNGRHEPSLNATIRTQWLPLPEICKTISINNNLKADDLKAFLMAKPQGVNHFQQYACRLLAWFGWPHLNGINWLHDYSDNAEKLRKAEGLFDHRAQDLFGALSLASHEYLPNCLVESRYGGHLIELEAVQNAF